jgi:hypothetical protein
VAVGQSQLSINRPFILDPSRNSFSKDFETLLAAGQSQPAETGNPELGTDKTTLNTGIVMLHDPVAMSFVIPMLAIILGIGVAVLAITLSYLKRRQAFALYHQERMAALEKGVDLPPLPDALITEDARPKNPRRLLLTGMVWLFVGIGLIIAVYNLTNPRLALFGLIPAGVGLAQLIYYLVAGRQEAELYYQERMAALQKR